MGLYCFYDTLAKRSGSYFSASNDAVALRQFRVYLPSLPEEVRGDFRLCLMAVFNDETLEIEPCWKFVDELAEASHA